MAQRLFLQFRVLPPKSPKLVRHLVQSLPPKSPKLFRHLARPLLILPMGTRMPPLLRLSLVGLRSRP